MSVSKFFSDSSFVSANCLALLENIHEVVSVIWVQKLDLAVFKHKLTLFGLNKGCELYFELVGILGHVTRSQDFHFAFGTQDGSEHRVSSESPVDHISHVVCHFDRQVSTLLFAWSRVLLPSALQNLEAGNLGLELLAVVVSSQFHGRGFFVANFAGFICNLILALIIFRCFVAS